MQFNRFLAVLTRAGLGLVACAAISGCSGRSYIGRSVAIDGLVPVQTVKGAELSYTGPLQIDIDNAIGSVEVRVDPKLAAPVVRSAVYLERAQKFTPGWVVAKLVDVDGEVANLQIVATPPEGTRLPVRLIVSVPKVFGLRITNNNGPVRATNLAGPIEVFNGMATMKGGDVYIELAQPAVAPIRVRSSQGDVVVSVPAGSAGSASVRGEHGAAIEDNTGKLRQAQRDRFGTSGVLSDLKILHEVRADNGKATLRVRAEDPVAAKPE